MLIESLDDPAFARALARRLLLPSFPIQGGACTLYATAIGPGNFGDCESGDYTFSTGKVGIGTASPQSALQVTGTIPNAPATAGVHMGMSGNYAAMQLYGSSGGFIDFSNSVTDADFRIIEQSGRLDMGAGIGPTGMTILSSGNIGIGTTNPGGNLEINSTGTNQTSVMIRQSSTVGGGYYGADLKFLQTSPGYTDSLTEIKQTVEVADGTHRLDFIANSGATPILTLKSGGNVGIGTTTPQQDLTLGSGRNFATEMATPTGSPTGTPTTGGSLGNGNYYYKITALDAAGGQTLAGPESAQINLSGSNNAVDLTWTDVVGASKYRVWRGTSSGGEDRYNEAFKNSYRDLGGGTQTAMPSLNTALAAKFRASGVSWFPYQLCAPPGGGFGLLDPGQAEPLTVLYMGGIANPDPSTHGITILRNFPPTSEQNNVLHTLLKIWAPPMKAAPASQSREATLALVRDLTTGSEADQEFLDLYNNGYSTSTQYGIRIQKRGSGQYRDFVFDQQDETGTKTPLMILKVDGKVGVGTDAPGARLEAADPSVLAAETLTNGTLTGGTSWSRTGDMALVSNAATYTHNTGSGTLTQASGSFQIAAKPYRLYLFTYTISGVSGTAPTASISTAFAAASRPLNTRDNGTHTVMLHAAASPGNFVVEVMSSAAGSFTIDSLSLKEVTGGDIIADGLFTGGGPSGIKVDNAGKVGIGTASPAASALLELSSTTGALIVPRMTTTDRNALTAVNGMIIYNTTTNQFEGRTQAGWTAL